MRLKGKDILFLDPAASVADRLAAAAAALAGRDELEDRFLPPQIRQLVDEAPGRCPGARRGGRTECSSPPALSKVVCCRRAISVVRRRAVALGWGSGPPEVRSPRTLRRCGELSRRVGS